MRSLQALRDVSGYSRNAFFSSLAAGLVVAIGMMGGWLAYGAHERQVAQAQADASEMSLGFVCLSAERSGTPENGPYQGVVSLSLYGTDTPHNAVKLRLAGIHTAGNSVLDLSSVIPAGVGSGASQIEFTAEAIDPTVTACLTMPHPRLQTPYRVTQTYNTTRSHPGESLQQVEFTRATADKVAPDDGNPCSTGSSAN